MCVEVESATCSDTAVEDSRREDIATQSCVSSAKRFDLLKSLTLCFDVFSRRSASRPRVFCVSNANRQPDSKNYCTFDRVSCNLASCFSTWSYLCSPSYGKRAFATGSSWDDPECHSAFRSIPREQTEPPVLQLGYGEVKQRNREISVSIDPFPFRVS